MISWVERVGVALDDKSWHAGVETCQPEEKESNCSITISEVVSFAGSAARWGFSKELSKPVEPLSHRGF